MPAENLFLGYVAKWKDENWPSRKRRASPAHANRPSSTDALLQSNGRVQQDRDLLFTLRSQFAFELRIAWVSEAS
jgi:hypothetical protein